MRRGACALCLLLAASLPPLHGQHSVYVDDTLRAFSGEGQLAAAMARARRNDELSSVVDGELDLGPHDELQDEIITNPSNLAFDAEGALFVASFTLDHVVRFRFIPRSADHPTRRARYRIFARDLDGPSALAVDHGGGLFVASFGGDEVLRFGADGQRLQRYGNEEEVDCPEGLALGGDGLLYVSSWHRGWVVRYNTTSGAFLGRFLQPAAAAADSATTAFPEELAFTPDGHLLVSHFYSNTLMLYTGPTAEGGGGESLGPLLRGKVLRGPVGMVVGPDDFL